jgi:KDO2-lipid IV(A) lauroyltransferase
MSEASEVEPPPAAAGRGPRRRRALRAELYGTRDGWSAHVEYWFVRAAVAFLLALPDSARNLVIFMLARVARVVDRRHTRAAERYLAQALGPGLSRKTRNQYVRSSYAQLAHMALDTFLRPRRIPADRVMEHFELDFGPEFEEVLRRGGPVVFLSCHVGDWEALGTLLERYGFFPIHVVAKPPRNRPLSIWIQELREASGHRVLSRYGAMQEAVAAVAQGGSLGLFLDHRATMRPIFAPFFGRPAACERASGVLLRRLKIPVVFTACYRTTRPWHYRIVAHRVLWPEQLGSMAPETIVTTVNTELEKLILAHPEQYYWLHDRFRGAPAAAEMDAQPG